MKLLLIGCLFFVGCQAEPDFVCDKEPDAIIENICIYKNGLQISDEDLRKSINIIDVVWSQKFDVDIFDIVSKHIDSHFNTQIEFVDKFKFNGGTQRNYVTLLFVRSDRQCIANTALGHEMLHVIGNSYGIDYGDHENLELFINSNDITQIKNSLENIINVKMCDEFCEENCLWYRIK